MPRRSWRDRSPVTPHAPPARPPERRAGGGPTRTRGVFVTTGAPKKLTYAAKARIVDGDDGRTYVAELTRYGSVTIMCGDMKFQTETIHQSDPRYAAAKALFS